MSPAVWMCCFLAAAMMHRGLPGGTLLLLGMAVYFYKQNAKERQA